MVVSLHCWCVRNLNAKKTRKVPKIQLTSFVFLHTEALPVLNTKKEDSNTIFLTLQGSQICLKNSSLIVTVKWMYNAIHVIRSAINGIPFFLKKYKALMVVICFIVVNNFPLFTETYSKDVFSAALHIIFHCESQISYSICSHSPLNSIYLDTENPVIKSPKNVWLVPVCYHTFEDAISSVCNTIPSFSLFEKKSEFFPWRYGSNIIPLLSVFPLGSQTFSTITTCTKFLYITYHMRKGLSHTLDSITSSSLCEFLGEIQMQIYL